MTIPELFLQEFDEEIPSTRRMLERVPEANFTWKPHEKSMTLGRLASHVADLPQRCTAIITTETLVRPPGFTPYAAASTSELLERLDTVSTEARTALATLREDQLSVIWTIKMGDRTIASLPRLLAYTMRVCFASAARRKSRTCDARYSSCRVSRCAMA